LQKGAQFDDENKKRYGEDPLVIIIMKKSLGYDVFHGWNK
jgi:hypothetical protein